MPERQKKTIDEVLAEFLAEQKPRLAARTFRKYENAVSLLKGYMEGYYPGDGGGRVREAGQVADGEGPRPEGRGQGGLRVTDVLRSLLLAAWEQPEPERLLVLADWLEESGETLASEHTRLSCRAGGRAAFSRQEYRRLAELDNALHAVPGGPWSRCRGVGHYPCPGGLAAGVATFRRAAPGGEDCLVLLFRERQVFRCVVQAEPGLLTLLTPDGQPLEVAEPPTPGPAECLASVFFPCQEQYEREGAAAWRTLGPAAASLDGVPLEVLPLAAAALASYANDKGRRVRAGQVVPGCHLFGYDVAGHRWRHIRSQAGWEGQQDVLDACRRLLQDQAFSLGVGVPAWVATAAVKVEEGGEVTARKLCWLSPRGEDRPDPGPEGRCRESVPLRRKAGSVPAAEWARAGADLRRLVPDDDFYQQLSGWEDQPQPPAWMPDPALLGRTFDLSEPGRLRGLFRPPGE